jgi:hypothetical protein
MWKSSGTDSTPTSQKPALSTSRKPAEYVDTGTRTQLSPARACSANMDHSVSATRTGPGMTPPVMAASRLGPRGVSGRAPAAAAAAAAASSAAASSKRAGGAQNTGRPSATLAAKRSASSSKYCAPTLASQSHTVTTARSTARGPPSAASAASAAAAARTPQLTLADLPGTSSARPAGCSATSRRKKPPAKRAAMARPNAAAPGSRASRHSCTTYARLARGCAASDRSASSMTSAGSVARQMAMTCSTSAAADCGGITGGCISAHSMRQHASSVKKKDRIIVTKVCARHATPSHAMPDGNCDGKTTHAANAAHSKKPGTQRITFHSASRSSTGRRAMARAAAGSARCAPLLRLRQANKERRKRAAEGCGGGARAWARGRGGEAGGAPRTAAAAARRPRTSPARASGAGTTAKATRAGKGIPSTGRSWRSRPPVARRQARPHARSRGFFLSWRGRNSRRLLLLGAQLIEVPRKRKEGLM